MGEKGKQEMIDTEQEMSHFGHSFCDFFPQWNTKKTLKQRVLTVCSVSTDAR